MNVGTALNKTYIPYTTVMLYSLCCNSNEHINAYLFNSELDSNDIEMMNTALGGKDISIIPVLVDGSRFSERILISEQWTLEAYYRLFMFNLLPEEIDRFLYLDGDIIVNKSLEKYYYSDFGGNEIIGCYDKSGLNTPDRYGEKHREMFAKAYESGYRYINSGVMLFDFAQMRKQYSFDTYLDAMEAWNYEMDAPDQDILNWVHWKKIGIIDYKEYDLFARVAHNQGMTYKDVKDNVAIIHFAGYKPWENGNVHYDIEKIWWDYAKETPFYEQLASDFIQSAITDRSVEKYLDNLSEQLVQKKQLLSKSMEVLGKLYG